MSYQYYQTVNPGWGTSQYRFAAPRAMNFQPQPGWGGLDFYQNYAGQHADPSLWNHAWNRVREYPQGSGGTLGVGLHEARHWHRKVYAYGELQILSPTELGHAAAYEAYRSWIHNRPMYEPLSGDYERQREGLVAIAVAEATELSYEKPSDQYSRMLTTEAAAATANVLFWESQDIDEEAEYMPRGRSRSRAGSFGTGSVYDDYDDPYAVDNLRHSRRGRSHSRHHGYSGVVPSNAMSTPYSTGGGSIYGAPSSAYGTPASAYGTPGTTYGSPGSYGTATSAYGATGYGASPYGTTSYGSPYGTGGTIMPGAQYATTAGYSQAMPVVISGGRSRSRHGSFSMPSYQPYATTATPNVMYPTSNQQPVVIVSSKHKHRKSHSRHRSRSRSRY